MIFHHHSDEVTEHVEALLKKFQNKDPQTLKTLAEKSRLTSLAETEALRIKAVIALQSSIRELKVETAITSGSMPHPESEIFHSRDPLIGLIQSNLQQVENVVQNSADHTIPEMQAFGEGNPVVWLPTGVEAVLDHFREKAPFQKDQGNSKHQIPDKCIIALLSDWGADNDHARRIGNIVKDRKAEYVIHLGDIYYSGSDQECQTFIKNWPLRDENGPIKGKSFALNGNHEMYSGGHGYFKIVLPALGQEASYFSLSNQHWQFFGLDTAYVPFSITGGAIDTNLTSQFSFLVQGLTEGERKQTKNILLSHNQPVSAHLPEADAAGSLYEEYWTLVGHTGLHYPDVFAWFFGHEHRCTIYDDSKTNFRARLIGNGSIPHYPQQEITQAIAPNGASTTPFTLVNRKLFENGPLAISTFVLITLDGPTAHVEYINEDGSLFYEEHWNS